MACTVIYGLCSNGLYSYGPVQSWLVQLWTVRGTPDKHVTRELEHLDEVVTEQHSFFFGLIGIADGMSFARVWVCRYSK